MRKCVMTPDQVALFFMLQEEHPLLGGDGLLRARGHGGALSTLGGDRGRSRGR